MKVYDIILQTPVGRKTGELKAKIENGRLKGFLSVVGHTEAIEGTVDENGRCSLVGKMVSLARDICFTADGTIDHDAIRLALRGEEGYYEIMGQLRKYSKKE